MKKSLLGIFIISCILGNAQINTNVKCIDGVKLKAINSKENNRANMLHDNSFATSGYIVQSEKYGGNPVDTQTAIIADDFTVPANTTWTIDTISIAFAFKGTDQADAYNLYIYSNNLNKPDTLIYPLQFGQVMGVDTTSAWLVDVGVGGIQLTAGKYWLGFFGEYTSAAQSSGKKTDAFLTNTVLHCTQYL